ncbi:MAG: RNA polymerase sigma factor [Microbacteriaceae bacterium]|nr:RNA polymerase sigma factor [Microbacteriaceae bacterium]
MTETARSAVDLDDFVAREYSKVVAAVGVITGSRRDAEDAVHDAIVGFLARPPRREIQNLAAWITVVASNRVRDLQRSRNAESRALAEVGVTDESTEAPSDDVDVDVDVMKALEQLPLQQRQACVLHYLLDQSIQTIAEGLGVTEGTVKTQLHRGRAALARRIERGDHRA